MIFEDCLVSMILVYLKNVLKLPQQKNYLSEFEAMLYLLVKGELDGVHYDEQEGVITLMERKKKIFEEQEDYVSLALTYEEEEALRRMEITCAREEGREEAKTTTKLDILRRQLFKKYNRDTIEWLENCSAKQLDSITELILEDMSYKDLQNKVLI